MATPGTLTWLETYSQAGAALSLIIEGTPTVFATDTMPSTYSADASPFNQFADPTTGLVVSGSIGSSIQLYAQDIQPESLEFVISDREGILAGTLLREAYANGHKTYLTTSVLAGATGAISVKSTTGFGGSGTIYIGDEAITYTTTTSTTFAGTIGRGSLAVNLTNGGTRFAPSHLIGNNVTTSATTSPAVTDYPRTWYGRFCHLILHVKDPLTGQYNLPSAALKIFSGRIKGYRDQGDGKISITATSAIELLNRAVGHEQWTGLFNEGMLLDSTKDTFYIVNSTPTAYNPTASLGFAGRTTHAEAAKLINDQFEAWRALGLGSGGSRSGDLWSIALVAPNDGSALRYRIRLSANSTPVPAGSLVRVNLHPDVWNLLGWDPRKGTQWKSETTGNDMCSFDLVRRTDALWEVEATQSPVVYYNRDMIQGGEFTTDSQTGTFVTQTVTDLNMVFSPNINGVVLIRGGYFDNQVYAVHYTAGSPVASFKILGRLNKTTGVFMMADLPEPTDNDFVRLGNATNPPTVTQVWYEHGPAGQVLLQALLSTGGTSGYNHASYDTRTTVGFGAGVPSSLIDIDSWEDLNDVTLMFLVTEPKPFYEYLEPVLQVSNRYVVWRAPSATRQPKLSIVRPTMDNSTSLVWQLTESNKALGKQGPDRVKIERAADGLINRVVVKYGHNLDGDTKNAKTWIIDDIASQSDYGRRRTVTLDAPGITNVEQVAPAALAPALAYFSRPLAVAERSYNASLLRMAPGDAVSLADNYIVDPTTGTRGGIIYGWVLHTSFDLATGQGRARIVFLPEKLPRVAKWSPSARVDETAPGGGYTGATKTLTTRLHEYSNAADAGDATHFGNGDKVHIYALDESSPLEWFDEVSGGSGSTSITLVTGLGGFDSTKRYVIEADDILTVQSSQRNDKAFIADDADLSTGGAIPTPYDWGTSNVFAPISFGTPVGGPDYTQGAFIPNSTYDDKGEPVSIHKVLTLVRAANNLYAYKTRPVYINQYLQNAATKLGTSAALVYMTWIPIYGHVTYQGKRALRARVYAKQAGGGTATITIRSSPTRPRGLTFTSFSYPLGETSVSFATTSSTFVWSSELGLTCSASPAPSEAAMHGCWITVEASGSTTGTTATIQGLFVAEAELT